MIEQIRANRRGFVAGAVTLAATGTAAAAIAATPTLDTIARDQLADHVNSTFRFTNTDGLTTSAKLIRVEKLNAKGARPFGVRKDSFAAIFQMNGLGSDAQDQTLTVSHPVLGKMDAYVQPVHSVTGSTSEVEIIFG